MSHGAPPIRPARSVAVLERTGAAAALIAAGVLLLGLVALLMLAPALRNWLVVLFMMNAGLGASLPAEPLSAINAIDIVALALAGVSFLGPWPILGRQHRFWTAIGVAQPVLGIPVLLATGSQGRSGVMGGGLVISILMLLVLKRGRLLAWMGLVANALLPAGDFGTGIVTGGLLVVLKRGRRLDGGRRPTTPSRLRGWRPVRAVS